MYVCTYMYTKYNDIHTSIHNKYKYIYKYTYKGKSLKVEMCDIGCVCFHTL